MSAKRTAAEIVTDRIIEQLEAGTAPWRKPWKVVPGLGASANVVSKRPYRGINVLLTGMQMFDEPWWITKKQAHQKGLRIADDQFRKSTLVVLWKPIEKACLPDAPGAVWSTNGPIPRWVQRSMLLRYYDVWNITQLDEYAGDPLLGGLVPTPTEAPEVERNATAEVVIHDYCHDDGPDFKCGNSNDAYYAVRGDFVVVPDRSQFKEIARFYGVAFHELGHSTGHKDRLDRKELHGVDSTFGSEPYAREELVAEITAAMCCARLGMDPAFEQSSAYVGHWLRTLNDDRSLIIGAAQAAQKATDLIFHTAPMPFEPSTNEEVKTA